MATNYTVTSTLTMTPNWTTDGLTVSNEKSPSLYNTIKILGAIIIIICIFGIIANALNLYVLSRLISRKLGVSPTYHLLLAMGIADLMVLLGYGLYAITSFARNKPLLWDELTEKHHDFHHVLLYMWYMPMNIFLMASNWCVVSTTTFRFLAVAFPMRVCQWCTLRRMRISICLIYFFSVVINIPDWLTLRFKYENGRLRMIESSLYNSLDSYYTVYLILSTVVPFVLNLQLVIFLIYQLYKTRHDMSHTIQDSTNATRQREHRRIGIMLVAIVLWFLVCYIPNIVNHIATLYHTSNRVDSEGSEFFQKLALYKDAFLLCNHAGNVVFYCLCNNTYRRMFINTLLCRRRTDTQSHATKSMALSSRAGSVSHRYNGISRTDTNTNLTPVKERQQSSSYIPLSQGPD